MLWHGSKKIFTKFALTFCGRGDHATNGALGIWCAFGSDEELAEQFAGRTGAVYGIRNPAGTVYPMDINELRDLHDAAYNLGDDAAQTAFYDRIRLDLIAKGYGCIDIVELDGQHSMCIVLDAEAAHIVSRKIRVLQAGVGAGGCETEVLGWREDWSANDRDADVDLTGSAKVIDTPGMEF